MHGRMSDRVSSRGLFAWLMAISVVCLLLPARWTEGFDRQFGRLMGPLSKGGRDISLAVTEDLRQEARRAPTVGDYEHLKQHCAALQRQVVNLRQEVTGLEELNARWSGLREGLGRARVELVLSAVLGSGSAGWSRTVQLGRGTLDGVGPGQLVLGGHQDSGESGAGAGAWQRTAGVVGRVADAGLRTSEVQLLSDPAFRLPVFIEPARAGENPWRADGVLKGGELGRIEVEFVAAEYPLEVGDWIVACPDPKYLPVGTVVGAVARVRRDPDNPVFWEVVVQPATDVHDLREVLVVVPQWQKQ